MQNSVLYYNSEQHKQISTVLKTYKKIITGSDNETVKKK